MISQRIPSSFTRSVLESLRRDCRVPDGATIVAGVSGGADSTAMLAAFAEARRHRVIAAHLDHALRPESANDAAFVRALAVQLGVEHREERLDWDDAAKRPRGNLEQAGRDARYAFLKRIAREAEAKDGRPAVVAVAHTADDQLETFLAALIRGAGPRGFSHPRAQRADGVVRPLLGLTRRQVLADLRERGLTYAVDSTNDDGSNLRSRLRRDVVPLLTRENPEIARAASRSARLFAGLDDAWTAHVRALVAGLVTSRRPGEILLDAARGRPYDRHAISSIVRETALEVAGVRLELECEALERIADAWRDGARTAVQLPGGVRVRMDAHAVSISTASGTGAPQTRLGTRELRIPGRLLWAPAGRERPDLACEIVASVRQAPADPREASAANVAWLDADCVALPVVVRSRTDGDRYRPMGLEGTAKVQDILRNRKVPCGSREVLPVVADRGGILWIPGLRVDERVRITERTTHALCVEARPTGLGME